MNLFDETLYTTSLSILLKYLKRTRGLKCEHINTLGETIDHNRYVLICKDKNKETIRIEVYEIKKKVKDT